MGHPRASLQPLHSFDVLRCLKGCPRDSYEQFDHFFSESLKKHLRSVPQFVNLVKR